MKKRRPIRRNRGTKTARLPTACIGRLPSLLAGFEIAVVGFEIRLANAKATGSAHGDLAPAGAIVPIPNTPGPSWRFELLLVICAATLLAVMALLAPHHLHLRHGGQALHSKSL
jgi:peptidoglycan/LPS O-acetylase OafA/YrhL